MRSLVVIREYQKMNLTHMIDQRDCLLEVVSRNMDKFNRENDRLRGLENNRPISHHDTITPAIASQRACVRAYAHMLRGAKLQLMYLETAIAEERARQLDPNCDHITPVIGCSF